MNEKYMWELWFKCKHPHPEYGGGDMVWPMEFAELIVAECTKILADNSEFRGCVIIGKHFGVEE